MVKKNVAIPKSARLPVCLFLCALVIGVVLVVVQLIARINWWWQVGKHDLWNWEARKEETLVRVRGLSQFVNILRGGEDWFSEEIVLNLDPDLLLTAQTNPWQLELNIDGDWQEINNFGGFMDLLKATPLMWHDKLVYRSEDEAIYSYDINFLTEELLLNKEMVQQLITQQAAGVSFQVPLSDLELVGQMSERIYAYYHNALDEGVMLWTDGTRDENDNLAWHLDPNIKGKIVNVGRHSLLLQGTNSNESWTFYQLKQATGSADLAWQRLTEVYDGSLPGKRFLGVDDNQRLIFAQAQSSRGEKQLILGESDMRLSEITALSLESGQEVRVQGAADLPEGVYQVAYVPSRYASEFAMPEELAEATDSAWLDYVNSQREFLALITQESVYRMDVITGEIGYQGSLDGLYDQPLLRRVMAESWCFERVNQPQSLGAERWVGMNLATGVALSGSGYCAESDEESRYPYVDKLLSRVEKEQQVLEKLLLPVDLRLTNGTVSSVTAENNGGNVTTPVMRSTGALNVLGY